MAFSDRLDELRSLTEYMASVGAVYCRVGDLECRLGASPASHDVVGGVSAVQEVESDPVRAELETLLHSSGADITPFLKRLHVRG